MVCHEEATQVAPVLGLNETFQDNGRNRERMQRSSRAKPQHVQGNKYTPFPSRAPSCCSVGCSFPTSLSLSLSGSHGPNSAASAYREGTLPTHIQCIQHIRFPTSANSGQSVERVVTADSRQNGHRPLTTGNSRQNGHQCVELPVSSAVPLSHPTTTTSTTSDDTSRCRLVPWPLVQLPTPISTPPCSPGFLYLYKHLPQVSSHTDYDRLDRSMQGLFEGCFYYQNLDNTAARAMLARTPEGTFLVRDSSDPRYLFSITVKTAKGASSVRVLYYRGFFQLDCEDRMKRKLPRFETLMDLLDFHVTVSRNPHGSQYRWQENSRTTDMTINLTSPRRHSPPSLSHLARVSVNQTLKDLHLPNQSTDLLPVPSALKHYLRAYPFKI